MGRHLVAAAYDGLRSHQDESASPLRPDAREGNPEGPVQRGEPGPWVLVDVDGELLAEGQLDDGLVLTTP